MKVAVSIPEDVYSEADRAAARLGLNRSQLYARALRRYLVEESSSEVTRLIDDVLDETIGDSVGPGRGDQDDLAPVAAADLIDSGSWEW